MNRFGERFLLFIISVCLLWGIYLFSGNFESTIDITRDFFDTGNTVLAQANTRDIPQILARAINGESRGESYIGQVAVGAVILNRVDNPSFPNSIIGVIYQPGAFTAVSDGQINVGINQNSSVYKAGKDAMNGWDPTGGCIYYYNPATATNKWIWSRPVVKTIGKHKFAK